MGNDLSLVRTHTGSRTNSRVAQVTGSGTPTTLRPRRVGLSQSTSAEGVIRDLTSRPPS